LYGLHDSQRSSYLFIHPHTYFISKTTQWIYIKFDIGVCLWCKKIVILSCLL
jgi:hypothetical protein